MQTPSPVPVCFHRSTESHCHPVIATDTQTMHRCSSSLLTRPKQRELQEAVGDSCQCALDWFQHSIHWQNDRSDKTKSPSGLFVLFWDGPKAFFSHLGRCWAPIKRLSYHAIALLWPGSGTGPPIVHRPSSFFGRVGLCLTAPFFGLYPTKYKLPLTPRHLEFIHHSRMAVLTCVPT